MTIIEYFKAILEKKGVNIGELKDNLLTTYLEAYAASEGVDAKELPNKLATTYLNAVLKVRGVTASDNLLGTQLKALAESYGESNLTDGLIGTYLTAITNAAGGSGGLWNPAKNPIVQGNIFEGNDIVSPVRLKTDGYIDIKPNQAYSVECNLPYACVYEYTSGNEVLMPEQRIVANGSEWGAGGYADLSEQLVDFECVVGETYVVTFDGVQYKCKCYMNDMGEIVIGDSRLKTNYDENGEPVIDQTNPEDVPFIIDYYVEGDAWFGEVTNYWSITTQTAGTFDIKIEHEGTPTYIGECDLQETPFTFATGMNTGKIRLVMAKDTGNSTKVSVDEFETLSAKPLKGGIPIVITGDEPFTFSSTNKALYFMESRLSNLTREDIAFAHCTHFTYGSGNVLADMNDGEFIFNITVATGLTTGNVSFKKTDTFTSLENGKAWFKKQYEKGTPVTVTAYIRG